MPNFSFTPPYLVAIYESYDVFKSFYINSNKELEKFREKLDKHKFMYTISCSKKEENSTHNSPLRIQGPTKKINKKRNKAFKWITESTINLSATYSKTMETLLKPWKK